MTSRSPGPRALCGGGVHRMHREHRGGCLIRQGRVGQGPAGFTGKVALEAEGTLSTKA